MFRQQLNSGSGQHLQDSTQFFSFCIRCLGKFYTYLLTELIFTCHLVLNQNKQHGNQPDSNLVPQHCTAVQQCQWGVRQRYLAVIYAMQEHQNTLLVPKWLRESPIIQHCAVQVNSKYLGQGRQSHFQCLVNLSLCFDQCKSALNAVSLLGFIEIVNFIKCAH